MEVDEVGGGGGSSEHTCLLARDNPALQRKREELSALVVSHVCRRGLFCPVKICKLTLQGSLSEHSLHFEKGPSRLSLVNTHGGASVRVVLHHQGASGSIRCSCTRQDCVPVLLSTLCNFHFLD
ncbi:121R protein [reindeer adenovirus 1]|uniref:121R protein n=1 Tax=reindeer adenovirus 1 TaxID=2885353 RepID=A0AAE9C148_9ADEN|nr:121R protein [reindeer adenovirus 1]